VVIGVITFFVLTDRPEQAKFLNPEERHWLVARIASERRATEAVRTYTLWQAMYNPKVLLLALNYFGIVTASLGMLIFVPQIIKSLGNYDNMTVGWLTMIPYISGGIAMVLWGRLSDRMNERRWNLFAGCVLSTIGLVIAGATMGTWWALVGMSIAAMGFYGSKGPFFAMPPMFLSGAGLAAGIAWINSIGNLGGFFGPWYVGVMKDLTGSYAGGLYGLALLSLVASIVCAFFLHIPSSARLRANLVGFIKAIGGLVSGSLDHPDEFAPGGAEAFVAAVIGGLSDFHGRPLPRPHAICLHDRHGDREAYLEIENLTGISNVVGEPWADNRNVLGGDGGLQFGKAGSHDLANVVTRNLDRNERRELRRGLNNAKRFDHGGSPDTKMLLE
jgi:hypothetical protein